MVSVIMSVFNGEKYLREALDSILKQTYADFEFIVVNDGSTDRTAEILDSVTDPRVKTIHQKNTGLTKSLNTAIAVAKGKYIARQDHDDVSEPDRFQKQVEKLEEKGSTVLVSGNLRYFSEHWRNATLSTRDFPPVFVKWLLLFYNHIGGHSQVMFRKDIFDRLGGYDEGYRYGQDYDLWLRMIQAGDLEVLPDVLLGLRHHETNVSKTAAAEQQNNSLQTSAQYIERYSGASVSFEEIELLRKFWLKGADPLSLPEIRRVDGLLGKVLQGLAEKGIVGREENRRIAKFVSVFFRLNCTNGATRSCRFYLMALAAKWKVQGLATEIGVPQSRLCKVT